MLLKFQFENFKSFKEENELSMIASEHLTKQYTIPLEKRKAEVLTTAVVYGANGSGKSSLVDAMYFLKHFIINSSNDATMKKHIPRQAFKLDVDAVEDTSFFEIIFLHNDIVYRYGFEVDNEVVHAEWLFQRKEEEETAVFFRELQEFNINAQEFDVEDLTTKNRIRPNALLLSVAAQFNTDLAISILEWFDSFVCISGVNTLKSEGYSMSMLENNDSKEAFLDFLNQFDLEIDDLFVVQNKFKDIIVSRKMYEEEEHVGYTNISMYGEESSGTQKLFAISGLIIYTLQNGHILVVDELDSKLHHLLVKKIISLFGSKISNPNGAQLIFNTHDINILDQPLLNKDQIWFVNKNRRGCSSLYALSDIDDVKEANKYSTDYLDGKYGAIPYVSQFEFEHDNEQ